MARSIKGINISTKSEDPLGRILTNPNWGLSPEDRARFFDVESEYKKRRTGNLAKDKALMKELQVKKFKQNPELIEEIVYSHYLNCVIYPILISFKLILSFCI